MTAQPGSTRALSSDAGSGPAPANRSSLRRSMLAVRQLRLTDFRNYRQLRLDCGLEPVVLVGGNGAGKTNLLEALSFLAPGRGLRRARLDEVGRRSRGEEPGRRRLGGRRHARHAGRAPRHRHRAGAGRERGSPSRRVVRIDGRPPPARPRSACMSPPSG